MPFATTLRRVPFTITVNASGAGTDHVARLYPKYASRSVPFTDAHFRCGVLFCTALSVKAGTTVPSA